LVECWM